MTESLREKLRRVSIELDQFEEGKPLPVSLADLHFLIGAASTLLGNMTKLEETYKADMATASADADKFRKRWKDARDVSVRLDNQRMSAQHVIKEAQDLSWWRKTKRLKLILESYNTRHGKNSGPGI